MKRNHLKIWKFFVTFCVAVFLSASAFATDIIVTGATAPYSNVNGTYIQQGGQVNGYTYWKHQTLSYYIFSYYGYWTIDTDTDADAGAIFGENEGGASSPATVISWGYADGSGAAPISVSEISINPEINLKGNNTTISSGDLTPSFSDYSKFGSALPNSGTAARTFTIQNTGASALNVGAISFSGTNAAEFTVTASPTSPVAASGSSAFTVTFTPTGTGDRNATISIVNDDSDENPYTFSLNGYGYTATTLVVSGITTPSAANGNYISQGVKNNFQYWKHATENYYIFNFIMSGVAPTWVIDNDQDGTNGSLFYYSSEAVSPNGLTPWNFQFGSGSPVISGVTMAPEINLVGLNSASIVSGDNTPKKYDGTNFGSLDYTSGSRTRAFTIQNTGTDVLTLSGTPYVSLSGATSDFSVTTDPSNSIAASGFTTFVITFNPISEGAKTAIVTISSNDSDEGTYTFTMQGDGITPKNLVLSGITTPSAFNGTYTYQGLLNEYQYWKFGSYYIYNNNNGATGDTYYWYIDSDTDPTSFYFRSANNGENASPVNVSSWTASMGVGTPVIQYAEPEMNITGNSTTINDGDVTPSIYDHSDFGWITSGTVTRTFTIQNLGTETLTLTGTSPYVVIGGANSADFSVTTVPSATIAAGSSTTFQVTASPSAVGVRSATLSFANTDTDENPYNFSIQVGLGISPVITTQAVNGISTNTATGNGNITTLGIPNPTSHGVCWNTSGIPTTADFVADNGAASATGAYTVSMTGLSVNTTYYVRAFATNTTGTSYGTEVSFITNGIAPTVTTQAVSSITASTATGNANITSLGIPNPSAHGICWNTTGNPTTANFVVNNGAASATGVYTASMIGLSANTTYYVRAFATNIAGTSYGAEVSFTTAAIAPTVTTQAVSGITSNSATGNGNITSLGVPNPTVHGVCWNTTGNPTTTDFVVDNGATSVIGAFTASMSSLTANTTYYVRAFATNIAGTSYGTEVSFTTNGIAPTVTTQAVASITANTATGNGNITSLGIPNPTAHGVCWNTAGTPTTANFVVDNGATLITGAFTASMTSLSANTTYYVRAFATNIAGTSYGTEVSFTTAAIAPSVTTQTVSDITANTATGNGNINSLGVPNPTAHGVCWNTIGTPTTTDFVADNGAASVTGAYTAAMTNLTASTTYYVRAFATNIAGTSYGTEVSFTTNGIAPTVTTQAVASITANTATGNGNITSLGIPNPTAHGVCWNTTGIPTTANFVVDNGATLITGAFTASMTSLSANTTYYVRAFATNIAGTSYGTEVSFTTAAIAPSVTTQTVSDITANTATGNGNINSLGVPNPTAHGVCWNTIGTPTTTDFVADNGAASVTGAYTAAMTNLTASTTYYVRAFATNIAGTSYGSEENFITATPSIAFTTSSSNGLESVNSANIQVDLTVASSLVVTVDYSITGTATGGGIDYTLANGTLTITAGNTSNDITIAGIVNDLLDETNETVIVTLSNPVNATLGTNTVHTYTITDNDATPSIAFNTTTSSGDESISSADLQLDLSAESGLPVSVDYTVTGTATGGGTDYTLANGTLTITAGNTSNDITIAGIVDDLLDETDETVIVTLSNPVNATLGTNTVYTYTITDNDATPSIAFNTTTSSGDESISSADLQLDLSAESGLTVSVDYTVTGTATGGGIDYTLANGTLTITAGNTSNDITIAGIVDDLLDEGDETIIVTLSNPVNATLGTNTEYTYIIVDNDLETAVSEFSKSDISVYPNPFTNSIHFDNVSGDISLIMISDLSGRTMLEINYNGEKDLNVNHLSSGVYLLTFVKGNGEKQIIKLVKE